ncbi:2-aminoethanethiol dioxygenase [Triplophysa tibetana]|uniref:2-aminoethanethiol dioxygenase n=1 Tax=Triplophysa tibetana TaxID=1572043 RepID=A0A5A9PZE7_9TELE|nr:2-aminoethanethiol dioxygenase [Triplophysa tibetana]
MPKNSKISVIQKIASQANQTFKNIPSSGNNVDNKVFVEQQTELVSLVSQITAEDLNIAPPKKLSASSEKPPSAPVTYMHICETDAFSMGVFLLTPGASIPLHDHPGMNGVLKVLYGTVDIRCYDKLDEATGAEAEHESQGEAVSRAVLRSSGQFTAQSGPCVLSPAKDNLHEIDAVDGPAAFLDILAPPYGPDDGRDCHYYKVLQTAGRKEHSEEDELWLLEIPQPDDFWCGGEPYPGPQVAV